MQLRWITSEYIPCTHLVDLYANFIILSLSLTHAHTITRFLFFTIRCFLPSSDVGFCFHKTSFKVNRWEECVRQKTKYISWVIYERWYAPLKIIHIQFCLEYLDNDHASYNYRGANSEFSSGQHFIFSSRISSRNLFSMLFRHFWTISNQNWVRIRLKVSKTRRKPFSVRNNKIKLCPFANS